MTNQRKLRDIFVSFVTRLVPQLSRYCLYGPLDTHDESCNPYASLYRIRRSVGPTSAEIWNKTLSRNRRIFYFISDNVLFRISANIGAMTLRSRHRASYGSRAFVGRDRRSIGPVLAEILHDWWCHFVRSEQL